MELMVQFNQYNPQSNGRMLDMADTHETPQPVFFAAPSDFRAWLERHHDSSKELLVGFYKKGSGKPSITWPESVDEALRYGWIDGVRKRIDDVSYTIRFTPRKPRSVWSTVNIKRVEELNSQGLMQAAGLLAFEKRVEEKSSIYAYEQKEEAVLGEAYEQQFRANTKAWEYFQAQAPWYKRTAIWQIVSAKREETRLKRLATLIESCEKGQSVPALTWDSRKKQ
jgi:uncharacterized protein YdeI (YjbR/CyaY-like superfamily)